MRSLTQHLKTNIDFVISWQAKYLIKDQRVATALQQKSGLEKTPARQKE